MLVEYHYGCRVFAGRFDEFLREWRAAPQSAKILLPDKRPAVRREATEDEAASYVTVHPLAWQSIKPQLAQRMALLIHPKRSRLCQACGASMRVVQETDQTWSFACEVCRSVEAWGKSIVGGQIGAGQKEKQ